MYIKDGEYGNKGAKRSGSTQHEAKRWVHEQRTSAQQRRSLNLISAPTSPGNQTVDAD